MGEITEPNPNPEQLKRLENLAKQLPQRKITSFGIVETTPKERGIFERIDSAINGMFPTGCPIISFHGDICYICELLKVQKEIQEYL